MTASLALVALVTFGFIGFFGPVIAGVYLAVRLNGRR
jgi:hypothetical protein